MGEALKGKPRDEYVISTKVGRIVLDDIEQAPRDNGEKGDVFANGRPNKVINDYSHDATLRSIEDSLKRLKTDHIYIVWVHDVARSGERRVGTAWVDEGRARRQTDHRKKNSQKKI